MPAEEDAVRNLANLSGVTNVMIPISTLEFLFQRFDMVERQLDEIKSLKSRSPVSPGFSASLAGTDTSESEKLAARVSALEKTIDTQNSLLSEINANCKLLLDNNTALKEALNIAQNGCSTISLGAGRVITLDSSPPSRNTEAKFSRFPPSLGAREARAGDNGAECCELIINDILSNDHEVSQEILNEVSYAVLGTVLPSFERSNIVHSRVLRSRDLGGR